MKDVNEKIKALSNKNFVIIMDNFSGHKSVEMINFYIEQGLRIMFNVEYQSPFNSIELTFRGLKKKIYSKLFTNRKDLKKEVINYLEDIRTGFTIQQNYRETLETYLFYSNKYDQTNLKFIHFDEN